MLDLVFQGGLIVDGSERCGYAADVGLANGRIEAIGDLSAAETRERLHIDGLALAPGFIDIHSHSDLTLMVDPKAQSKVRQGVTTEVIGNCGFSPAPVGGPHGEATRRMSFFVSHGGDTLSWDWTSMGDYMTRLAAAKPAVNVVPLIGHLTLRAAAMGFENRPPSLEEMERMQSLLRQALEEGVFGMSSGLIYPPSSFADTEELVALSETVAQSGGLYFTHIRGEGATLLRAVAEAIEIGERAGIPVQIAHHKAAGRRYWGRIREAVAASEAAVQRGADITFDVYPYTAGSTSLDQLVPTWAHSGGREALLQRLVDQRLSAQIRRQMEARTLETASWDDIYLSWVGSEGNKDLEGKSLAEAARMRHLDPPELVLTVLAQEKGQASMISSIISEDDVRYVIKQARAMIGSDGSSLSPHGRLGEGKPHPRNYGTFPRVLEVYVRQEGLLSLEEAIRKMTSAPAKKLGLTKKGQIRRGMDADLVVFDPNKVHERSTYADPHQYPEGIPYVVVNGQVVVREGEHTGALPGKVLERAR